MPEQGGLR
uniref:Uncharacterized protein n=1 Tax=Anguilla anguilla TaxID=7936 RepID=A0A0E9VTM7_ANGAN